MQASGLIKLSENSLIEISQLFLNVQILDNILELELNLFSKM